MYWSCTLNGPIYRLERENFTGRHCCLFTQQNFCRLHLLYREKCCVSCVITLIKTDKLRVDQISCLFFFWSSLLFCTYTCIIISCNRGNGSARSPSVVRPHPQRARRELSPVITTLRPILPGKHMCQMVPPYAPRRQNGFGRVVCETWQLCNFWCDGSVDGLCIKIALFMFSVCRF